MEHTSIIYSKGPSASHIPVEVFSDLKIDGILPDNVLDIMSVLPDEADMRTRQQIFEYLLDKGTTSLEDLSFRLRELIRLWRAYDLSNNDETKAYIFAAILKKQKDFYLACADIDINIGFFAEFKKHFASLTDPTLTAEADRVYDKLVRTVGIDIKDQTLTLRTAENKGYIKDIRRCAAEMDIELSEPTFSQKELGAEIALSLSKLYPDVWKELSCHREKYKSRLDHDILAYPDALDFYIFNTELARKYISHSIPYCYAHRAEDISIAEGYDITLMAKECYDIIPNDISFNADTPVSFLCGANGGGKTTYLRTVGLTVIFALCGCPVPARHARVCTLHAVHSHFPRDERFELEGRFLDEQKRVDGILSDLGERSLVLLNETYATTNEEKASQKTLELAEKLKDMGQFSVYVTHQKSAGDSDIPMLTCVVDEGDGKRTYKIKPLKRSVRSYAEDILKKYSLSRADLEERFGI